MCWRAFQRVAREVCRRAAPVRTGLLRTGRRHVAGQAVDGAVGGHTLEWVIFGGPEPSKDDGGLAYASYRERRLLVLESVSKLTLPSQYGVRAA